MDKSKKGNKKNLLYLVLLILLGGFIGSIMGEILGFNFEEGNFFHTFLTNGVVLGLTNPFCLDLKVLTLNFGFTIKFSFLSIIGFLLGIFLYKKTV